MLDTGIKKLHTYTGDAGIITLSLIPMDSGIKQSFIIFGKKLSRNYNSSWHLQLPLLILLIPTSKAYKIE